MRKKSKKQATPEIEWPENGGSYIRDPDTGALAKIDPTVIPTTVGTQSTAMDGGSADYAGSSYLPNINPANLDTSDEDLNHGT